MRTLQHTFYYPSRSDTFRLYHLTDLHIGHAACNELLIRQDVERIAADPNAYWGGGGDYIDAISRKNDFRYVESSLAPWLRMKSDPIGRQIERFLEIVEPIAGKCLYLGTGNHEAKVLEKTDRDVYLAILRGVATLAKKEIDEIAINWEGFVQLKFRRGTPEHYGGTQTITVYTHHGSGGGRKQGGHALRMEEVLLTYECDLALLGHRHVQQVIKKQSVAPAGKKVKFRERIGVWCGSYLESYIDEAPDGYPSANYAQAMQLAPTSIGTVPIVIKPDVRMIMPVITNGLGSHLMDLFWTPKLLPGGEIQEDAA